MAEDFLEEVYRKSLVPDMLRDCVDLFNRSDYDKARKAYNEAISVIEKMLPEYAAFDRISAERLQNAAVDIAGNFGDTSYVTGTINGKLIPELYRYLSHFTDIEVEDGGYLIKSTDSGFLTVRDQKPGLYLHDVHDPMEEAGRIADIIYDAKMEEIHILGCGLGYLPYKIWSRSGGAVKIIIYEESPEMLAYAENYGVLSWIDSGCLETVCDSDEKVVLGRFMDIVEYDNEKKCVYISPHKRNKFFNYFDGNFEYVAALLAYKWGLDATVKINAWKNLKHASVSFEALKKDISSGDWIVVAAGPSLDYNIDFIKENKGKKKIVAVNTVLRRLNKEGIKPDLVVVADSNDQILEHIQGAEELTEGVPLIADYVTNWKFISHYRGDITFICTPSCIGITGKDEEIWDVSGTITSLAMDAAARLGAKKVYLVGVDLAYPGGKNYAGGMPHDTVNNAKGGVQVPSVDGKMVDTVPVFLTFISIVEKKIADCKQTQFYNMSKNGALLRGASAFYEQE
ncbi:MAG: DUF115 domain-containing protein [Butyrivibrio sp.]|nr:DUF115 domain-containing protein [Butyrivibrio sp.]